MSSVSQMHMGYEGSPVNLGLSGDISASIEILLFFWEQVAYKILDYWATVNLFN